MTHDISHNSNVFGMVLDLALGDWSCSSVLFIFLITDFTQHAVVQNRLLRNLIK